MTHTRRSWFFFAAISMTGATFPVSTAQAEGATSSDAEVLPREIRFNVLVDDCAITQAHELRCWDPQGVDATQRPGKFISISQSKAVHCAIREDRQVECWGNLPGPGPITMPSFDERYSMLWLPKEFSSGSTLNIGSRTFRRYGEVCGILADGTASCSYVDADIVNNQLVPTLTRALLVKGDFISVTPTADYWQLLRRSGEAVVKRRPGVRRRLPAPEGFFSRMTAFGWLTTSGERLVLSNGKYQKIADSNFALVTEQCQLFTDGRAKCTDRQFREVEVRGPLVDVYGACGVKPDGSLTTTASSDDCHMAPEDLRVYVQGLSSAPLGPTRLEERLALSKARNAVTGSPKEYKVVLKTSLESYFLEIGQTGGKGGATLTSGLTYPGPSGTVKKLVAIHSILTIVDLNGNELEYGDPIHISQGNLYLRDVGGKLGTTNAKKDATVWSFVSAHDGKTGALTPYRGQYDLLLLAPSGRFLIPCSETTCNSTDADDEPGRNLVSHVGARPGLGPYWVADPFFEPQKSDLPIWRLGALWEMWPLVPCTIPTSRTTSKKATCALVAAYTGDDLPEGIVKPQ